MAKTWTKTIKIPSFPFFGKRIPEIQIMGILTSLKVNKTLTALESIKNSPQSDDHVAATAEMLMLIKKEHPNLPINRQEFSPDIQTRLEVINNAEAKKQESPKEQGFFSKVWGAVKSLFSSKKSQNLLKNN